MAHHDEEDATSAVRARRQTSGKVPADIVKQGADNQVGELRDDKTSDEWSPVVRLALLLSGFKDVSPVDEQRLELKNHTPSYEDEIAIVNRFCCRSLSESPIIQKVKSFRNPRLICIASLLLR